MNLEEFETQYRDAIDETLNQLQTVVLLLAQLQARITNVGQDLQNLSQTVEDLVTAQKLDADSKLVLTENQFKLTESPQLETLTSNPDWPSPVVYPLRPPKGRKSFAAVELPTFTPISHKRLAMNREVEGRKWEGQKSQRFVNSPQVGATGVGTEAQG